MFEYTNKDSTGKVQPANYISRPVEITISPNAQAVEEEFTFNELTNNKSTGEAQPANYLKSRTEYYTTKCQSDSKCLKQEKDELNPALKHSQRKRTSDISRRTLTKCRSKRGTEGLNRNASACRTSLLLTFRYEASLALQGTGIPLHA
jgi:hypothetical protein